MSITTIEKRILSYLVDYAIAFIFAVLIVLFIKVDVGIKLPFLNRATKVLSSTFFVYFVISSLSLLIFKGKTIGRMFTGLKVESISGANLSISQILIRSLSESLIIFGFMSCFYVLHYKNGYTLFDKISDTVVK